MNYGAALRIPSADELQRLMPPSDAPSEELLDEFVQCCVNLMRNAASMGKAYIRFAIPVGWKTYPTYNRLKVMQRLVNIFQTANERSSAKYVVQESPHDYSLVIRWKSEEKRNDTLSDKVNESMHHILHHPLGGGATGVLMPPPPAGILPTPAPAPPDSTTSSHIAPALSATTAAYYPFAAPPLIPGQDNAARRVQYSPAQLAAYYAYYQQYYAPRMVAPPWMIPTPVQTNTAAYAPVVPHTLSTVLKESSEAEIDPANCGSDDAAPFPSSSLA